MRKLTEISQLKIHESESRILSDSLQLQGCMNRTKANSPGQKPWSGVEFSSQKYWSG